MRRSLRQLLVLFALPVLALIFTPQTTAAQGGTIRGRPLRRSDTTDATCTLGWS